MADRNDTIDIREKMRRDWDRRANVDPRYWVAATQEADVESYVDSAKKDVASLLEGIADRVSAEARALDLGCGIGRLSAELSGRFREIVGVDVSPVMIAAAKELHGDKPGLHFEANNGVDLSGFADASFDFAFSYSVLPHIPTDVLRSYFAEVSRVLKHGALFRYQFWVGAPAEALAHDTLSIRAYGEDEFMALNTNAGFEVELRETIDYFDPILKMNPCWVNVRRVGEAKPVLPLAPRENLQSQSTIDETASMLAPAERELEYGLLLYLAVKHAERGELPDAERVLENAISIEPKRAEAYIQWAAARLEVDDFAGALKLMEAVNEQVPDEPIAWLYRAQFAYTTGDKKTASMALDRLAALKCKRDDVRRGAQALRRKLRQGG